MKPNFILCAAIGFLLTACTPQEPPPVALVALQKNLAESQKRLTEIDTQIKNAGDDAHAAATLVEEKALVESSILRTKEKLKAMGALPAEAPAGGGGGGHH